MMTGLYEESKRGDMEMSITVSDIEQKEFAFKGGGYDPYDVDSYLDQICDEMIALQDRIDELQTELNKAKAEVDAAKQSVKPMPQQIVREDVPAPVAKTSETLENILLSAQRISDEAIENAKKRAEEMIKEAQGKASEIVDNALEEKGTLQKELTGMRDAANDYKKRFLALINEHRDMLEMDDALFQADQDDESKV